MQGALEEGGCHPQHWGPCSAAQPEGGSRWLEGSVNWRVCFHPAFPGCGVTTITTAFFFHLLDSSLPAGWSVGGEEEGLNKYLHLFQKEGQVDHNDSLRVYTTQGVRHKFTCGKQAIHRCNPTKNPCDQTINLCKVAASILISSHCLWILFAVSHAR